MLPGSSVFDLFDRVADALGEVEFDPEAPNVLDAGLAELGNFIDLLSWASISVVTSALFDFILAAAQHEGQEWRDGGFRRGCILRLARDLDGASTASDLLGSGYAQRAVEAACRAAQAEREADVLEEARKAEEARVAETRRASEAKAKACAAARRVAESKANKERAAARRAAEANAKERAAAS